MSNGKSASKQLSSESTHRLNGLKAKQTTLETKLAGLKKQDQKIPEVADAVDRTSRHIDEVRKEILSASDSA